MNRKLIRLCLLLATLCAGGCATPPWLTTLLRPYRPDVQQGNIITKDMVDQLRTGMTRDQVRFLLGTPMLTDIFHQDRWDYPYVLLKRRDAQPQIRRLYVVFEEGKLARYTSDEMPTEPLADSLILGSKLRAPAKPAAPAPAVAPDAGTAPGSAPGSSPGATPNPAPTPQTTTAPVSPPAPSPAN